MDSTDANFQDFLTLQKNKDTGQYIIGAYSNSSLAGSRYFMKVMALSGNLLSVIGILCWVDNKSVIKEKLDLTVWPSSKLVYE